MNKLERVSAVVNGHQPDRPPVSFWYHFGSDLIAGRQAVDAHIRHCEAFDLDFLKVMNDCGYPRPATASGAIEDVADLERLSVLRGDEDNFGKQLELVGAVAEHYAGELYVVATVFNAWTTLRRLTARPSNQHRPPSLETFDDPRDSAMTRFLREAPETLQHALDVVAESLANFSRHCLAAGAGGVFFSVRDDSVDTPNNGDGVYDRLVHAGDLKILDGAGQGKCNMLHVCGKAVNFNRFAKYPVHVINWADRYAGPTISEVVNDINPAICAGLNNLGTLVSGTTEECVDEVADALHQANGRPIMIGPGCTFDSLIVPPENLHAVRSAVDHSVV